MSICYRMFFIDEFDWKYVNFDRQTVINQVKLVAPQSILEADIYGMMIFDVDKTCPDKFVGKVTCDCIKYQTDSKRYEIKDADKYMYKCKIANKYILETIKNT